MRKKRQHGIENEPQLQPGRAKPDPSEAKADRVFRHAADTREAIMRTGQAVFDEPHIFDTDEGEIIDRDWTCSHCGYNLRGLPGGRRCPECGKTELYRPAPAGSASYRTWLEHRLVQSNPITGWFIALIAALVGGPISVITTFLDPHSSVGLVPNMLLMICLVGPVVEEVMKIGVATWIVEQKPYLFGRSAQIYAAAAGAAFLFAAIENLLYLHVYFPDQAESLFVWRWTGCVALHVGCSLIAARGLVRVWDESIRELRKPRIAPAIPMIMIAIAVHCTYNTLVMLYEMS